MPPLSYHKYNKRPTLPPGVWGASWLRVTDMLLFEPFPKKVKASQFAINATLRRLVKGKIAGRPPWIAKWIERMDRETRRKVSRKVYAGFAAKLKTIDRARAGSCELERIQDWQQAIKGSSNRTPSMSVGEVCRPAKKKTKPK